jgi:hypothetical protein
VKPAFRAILTAVLAAAALSCSEDPLTVPEPTFSLDQDTVHVAASDFVFVTVRPEADIPVTDIVWSTGDASIASYSRLGDTRISVWGRKPGNTTLTATLGSESISIPIVVSPEVVGAIYVHPRVLAVAPGRPGSIEVYVRTTGENEGNAPVTASSDDPSVAVVGAGAATRGTATVIVTAGPKTGSAKITVSAGNHSAVVDVHVPTPYNSFAIGRSQGCAWKPDGSVFCWGSNQWGEFGVSLAGNHLPTNVELPPNLVNLAITSSRTCGLTNAGEVFCWGLLKQTIERPGRMTLPERATAITGGSDHVCVLGASGVVYCEGHRWGAGGSSGTARVEEFTAIPSTTKFESVVAGRFHTCALDVEANAYCWGLDNFGQLGDAIPERTNQVGRSTPLMVVGGHKFASLFSGSTGDATCGRTIEDETLCWGAYVENPDAPTTALCWTTEFAQYRCTPSPIRMSSEADLTFIEIAGDSGCGLETSGRMHCWGRTPEQNSSQAAFRRVPAPAVINVRLLSMQLNFEYGCGLGVDRLVYCWGANASMQGGNDFRTYIAPLPSLIYGPTRLLEPTLIAAP